MCFHSMSGTNRLDIIVHIIDNVSSVTFRIPHSHRCLCAAATGISMPYMYVYVYVYVYVYIYTMCAIRGQAHM